jgi:glycosyltransferase involved in cell wall biosynthesis
MAVKAQCATVESSTFSCGAIMQLTIVTTCSGYGQYLNAWARSITTQTMRPHAVIIFTHGSDSAQGSAAATILTNVGFSNVRHEHCHETLDFGEARNRAVALAQTDWVMHFDADDTLLPNAIADFTALAPDADVISAGYVLSGNARLSTRDRCYQSADGIKALDLQSLASGISPFRKSFWVRSPYRTDMMGAWDTALWIGFARLGARFRATSRAVFHYNQHADSIFNQRRTILGWKRVRTAAQLKALRRQYFGAAIIVPRDLKPAADRERVWHRVRAHYETHHPQWPIAEGRTASGVWIKGAAIADAINKTNADVLIIADADCIVDPAALTASVNAVCLGAPWAMPHRDVYRADATMTARYCAEPATTLPILPDRHSVARDPYVGVDGGGIVVIRRVWYDAIGGIPLAFRGWGSEDRALAGLANNLLGPCVRGDADLLHLHHEPQNHGRQSAVNLQLLQILGQAAQRGKDALVGVAYSMPNPGIESLSKLTWRANVGTARPPVSPETLERMTARASQRRRAP